MSTFERFRDLFGSGAGDHFHTHDHDGHDPHAHNPNGHNPNSHGQEGGSQNGAGGAPSPADSSGAPEARAFEDVRDDFVFTGFSESQQKTILGQLEDVWETDSGRSMLEAGLNGPGLHYLNINEQSVISTVSPRIGMTPDQVPGIGNFALPTRGEIFLNAYEALEENGSVQVYTGLHPSLDGQSADAKASIRSLDTDGEVFTVPPIYTMIHETNHVARGEPDIPRNRAPGVEYDRSMVGTTSLEAAQAYAGLNEVSTREILTEMGLDQQRGAYNAAGGLDSSDPGTDYGLGRDHDVGVTSARATDMTGHAPVDAVVIDSLTQDALNGFGVPSRTDLLDHTFLMGRGDDTVHAFDGNDTLTMGGGDDRAFAGLGDDVFNAGRGNDVYDGGDANLDPASDHRSDAATDWGFDSVDYTSMPVAFSPPEVDGSQIDGVVISVGADEILVDKGQAFAPMLGSHVDQLNTIDRVVGTDRDDVAQVSDFRDGTVLSGGAGVNVLDISTMPQGEVTHAPGSVVFNGAIYDGVIERGGDKLYYEDYTVVDGTEAEAVGDSPDVGVPLIRPASGELKGAPDVNAVPDFAPMQSMTLPEAARTLDETATDAVAAGEASDADVDTVIADMLKSGGAAAMMTTLHRSGEATIDVSASDMNGTALDQARGVVVGMGDRVVERGLEQEVEAELAAAERVAEAAEISMSGVEPVERSAEAEAYDYAV